MNGITAIATSPATSSTGWWFWLRHVYLSNITQNNQL